MEERYLRTKDWIIPVSEVKYYRLDKIEPMGEKYYADRGISEGDWFIETEHGSEKVIKKSDTIEELCDRFIIEEGNAEPRILKSYTRAQYYFLKAKRLKLKNGPKAVYGAIFVKGKHDELILKTVAKMKDTGDLELL